MWQVIIIIMSLFNIYVYLEEKAGDKIIETIALIVGLVGVGVGLESLLFIFFPIVVLI